MRHFFSSEGPGDSGVRSFVALWNLGHLLFFALTSWLLCLLAQHRRPEVSFPSVQVYVFLLVFLLGVAIEVGQMANDGRSPDFADISLNQLGCLITFACFCSGKKKRGLFLPFRLTVAMLVVIALSPLFRAVTDELTVCYQFPLLSDFETPFESTRWRDNDSLSVEEGIARHGKHSLKVQLTTETYSGAALSYFPGNWQGFEWLFISVYSPGDAKLDIVCRVNDAEHDGQYADRFNRKFVLEKGWSDLVIPLHDIQGAPATRMMNMEKIKKLKLFVVKLKKERTIYIDNVYLGP